MKKLVEVIESWDAWANSAGYDERNPDLQSCIKEIREAYERETVSTPPTYTQGQEEVAHRLQRVLEDLNYIEGNWPDGFDDAWPLFDEPREKIAVACQEMLRALPIKEGGV